MVPTTRADANRGGEAEAMTVIEARGLRKTFGTNNRAGWREPAREEGRIVGLIGPNGAGKSTALSAMLASPHIREN